MNAQPKRILLIAYFNSHLPQFLELVRFFHEKIDCVCTLLYVNDVETLQPAKLQAFLQRNCEVIDRNGEDIISEQLAGRRAEERENNSNPKHRSRIFQFIKRVPLVVDAYRFIQHMRDGAAFFLQLRAYKRLASEELQRLKPTIICLPEENTLLHTATYTTQASQRSIPMVVFPYTIANATEFAESNFANSDLWVSASIWNRVVAKAFKRWAYIYRGRTLLLQTWPRILVTELLRLAPPDPWIMNSGFAKTIAVESSHMMRYFLENNISASKLSLVGSLSDDKLRHGLNNRPTSKASLIARLGLDPKKPIMLVALPPPWFPRAECDFPTFEALVDFWMKALQSQERYNVLVHLHPRLRYEDIKYIEKQGVRIAQGDIVEYIPLADLYVANISATIRWAIACGIPVINYDVYKWKFHDYASAGGVVTIDTQHDFVEQIQKCANDIGYYNQLANRQRACAHEWAILDGFSGDRLLKLLDKLGAQQ